MQAAHQRRLRPGREYERYFQLKGLEQTDPILANGDTFETIRQMDKWIRHYQSDTAALAPTLRGDSLRATCENIWNFAYQHFQYKLDKEGVEQIRRPLRSWADRQEGIDCDCYSILISSILLNLKIPHKLRKTKYNNKPDFQHIYVIVPQPGRANYITIDPVVDRFDYETPYTGHYDHLMQIQGLNGVPAPASAVRGAVPGSVRVPGATLSGASGGARMPWGAEFLPLQQRLMQKLTMGAVSTGLSPEAARAAANEAVVTQVAETLNATPAEAAQYVAEVATISAETLAALRAHLINTRQQILSTKETTLYVLADAIANVLAVWDNPAARNALIAEYGAAGTVPAEMEIGSYVASEYRLDMAAAPMAMQRLNGLFDAVGDFFSGVGHAVGQAASWVGNQVTTAAHAVGQAASWVGNGVANGATAAWTGIKKASSWVAQQAVVIGKLILKYNPLTILIRAALRVAFRVNLFYMTERLVVGLATDEQAKAAGLDEGQFRKAQDRMESVKSMWHGLQGDPDNLHNDIIYGNAHASSPAKIPGLAGAPLRGLGAAGADDAAGVVAASGFIATIGKWLGEVDWKKLFNTAKDVAAVASSLAKKYAAAPIPADTYKAPGSEADYYANQAKYDNPPVAGSSTPLLLAGAGIAAYFIFA